MGQNLWGHIWVDEHPFTIYFDVHQGYRVLTHCHILKTRDKSELGWARHLKLVIVKLQQNYIPNHVCATYSAARLLECLKNMVHINNIQKHKQMKTGKLWLSYIFLNPIIYLWYYLWMIFTTLWYYPSTIIRLSWGRRLSDICCIWFFKSHRFYVFSEAWLRKKTSMWRCRA